jgi:putative component of membrane protein insertase Oxa1/YidC/SpoIIIJ protein YidD
MTSAPLRSPRPTASGPFTWITTSSAWTVEPIVRVVARRRMVSGRLSRRQLTAIRLLSFYQTRFSTKTPSCVFTPSCSEYAQLAIAKGGVVRGVWRTALRLRRCHGANVGIDYP